ncbi:MAG TPA: N-6 DNA methylase [Ktedonobacteraceae bacterium]
MLQNTSLPLDTSGSSSERVAATPALERRGVQNQGGFLTPYYLFELLGRQHGDELDPHGRDSARRFLKQAFHQAMRGWSTLGPGKPTLAQTQQLWYTTLFQTLGFPSLRQLDSPAETNRHGLVPISHAVFLDDSQDEAPFLFLDLHPFGTDLDQDLYIGGPGQRHKWYDDLNITRQPVSRALEFALDHHQARWALLSNGSELRLYRKGGSIARQYLKIDFPALFDRDDDKEWLAFWGLFRFASFIPSAALLELPEGSGAVSLQHCLLDRVIEESQRHATKIADDLRENMVRAVEALLQGVIDSPSNRRRWQAELDGKRVPDEIQLRMLFKEAIYFLYRLLFILYAESRDLLPVSDSRIYRETYSLEHLRDLAERRVLRQEDYDKTYYIQSLRTLFALLRSGYPRVTDLRAQNSAQALAPFVICAYDGQLFDPERTALLSDCHIPDLAMCEVILELSLSHPKGRHGRRERYSYADLGVDQLGSIYEGLLVYEPSIAELAMVEARVKNDIRLVSREQADELELSYDLETLKPAGSFLLRIWGGRRKGSGSYYTPQQITTFLVKDALAPLAEPIIEGCGQRDEQGRPLRSAEEILLLKVCDPAMGSGAFLVQACRYLGEAYGRALIAEGRSPNERVTQDELARYKRRVAEKCIYGVDLNPLAVELARVSLWLETLAHDRPLTFLDAHLRCGNALIGVPLRDRQGRFDLSRLMYVPNEAYGRTSREEVQAFRDLLAEIATANRKQLKTHVAAIRKGQMSLFGDADFQKVITGYEQCRFQLEESDEQRSIEDAVALVHRKQALLQQVFNDQKSELRRFKQLCDLWCATWFWPQKFAVSEELYVPPPTTIVYYDLAGVIFERSGSLGPPAGAEKYLEIARRLAEEDLRFFHWEIEFPEVWYDENGQPLAQGGFDVIVGNPPWEAVKPNSKEFWSNYLPTFRTLGKQAAIKASDTLRVDPEIDTKWRQYVHQLSQQTNVFKQKTLFASQGGGDVNTYKLFLEQVIRLTRPGGTFSLVLPSGIYTDKNCTSLREQIFFKEKTRYILAIENRKSLFPIDSRFKVVLFSGMKQGAAGIQESLQQAADQTVACLFLVGKDGIGQDLAPSSTDLGVLLPALESRLLHIPSVTIQKLAPATLSLMEFKGQHEIDLAMKIYGDCPLMGEPLKESWNVVLQREFHMTDDSPLFNEQAQGWPLWEGKMIYQFACDYAQPRYWIEHHTGVTEVARRVKLTKYRLSDTWAAPAPKLGCENFRLVYRKIASNTNEVTLITAILPMHNFIGHSLDEFVQWAYVPAPVPAWLENFDESHKLFLMVLLNSFVLNFVIRQKISANVSAYLLNQLPIPRLPATHPISQALVPLAARLTCVDERFAPLWESLARQHPGTMDLAWSPGCAVREPGDRAKIRAEMDARVADLYHLSEKDFAYLLSTFPLLDRDQPALPGEPRSFVTRDLALLALFSLRGKEPPTDVGIFFADANVDIRHQTSSLCALRERVLASEASGAVAYQPGRREREESELADREEGEVEFDEEE